MNELKIEHEDKIKRAKEIFVTTHTERDSVLSSLELEKKENEELQSSIFRLTSTVTEQNKLLATRDEEIYQLKEIYLSEKKRFQSLTTSFVHALKSECQRLLSFQYANLNFTPIHQIFLKDLSEVV